MPEHTADQEDAPAPQLPVALDMPGKVADFPRTAELDPAERDAFDHGVTVWRGQGRPGRWVVCPVRAVGVSTSHPT